jgi:hypothetical protein
MDYEKGKVIEDVVYQLQKISSYDTSNNLKDLDRIYRIIDSAVQELNRILGKDY